MEAKREPDPRWASFIEYLDSDNKVVGFTLPNTDHLFKYDSEGGWHDQHGNYYNAEGILQDTYKEEESIQDEQDDESYRDDELVDQFQELLKEEELGISRKPIKKQVQPKPIVEEEPKPQLVKQKEEFDFKSQIQKYLKKEHLKQGLSQDLFIYFKQRPKYFEEIVPQVEKKQSVDNKNKAIKQIKQKIEAKRVNIIQKNKWLAVPGVFLDISGSSEAVSDYDRYWYGHIKTNANQYLGLIEQIQKSEQFSLLQIKTFYALKSKFYLKKSQQKIKNTIKQLKQKVNAAGQNQSIEFVLDSLPQYFPLSFVYDLVDYVGGNPQDIQEVYANDQFSATLHVLKDTALKLVNIEGYNHDKGEFIQLEFKGVRQRVSSPQAHRFYFIGIDSQYKLPERELNDTLALEINKNETAKVSSAEEQKVTKIRFVVGSVWALRRVLMFRGESLNVVLVKSKI